MGEMIVRYMMEPGANLSWRFGVLMASLHLAFASFMTSRVYRGSDSKLGFWLHDSIYQRALCLISCFPVLLMDRSTGLGVLLVRPRHVCALFVVNNCNASPPSRDGRWCGSASPSKRKRSSRSNMYDKDI
jgi:hypothetical protein